MSLARLSLVPVLLIAAALSACSDPTSGPAASLADGQCSSLRKELNGLDARGVPSLIERKNSGGRLSADQEASVERYNSVLNSYLGGSCASDVRYKATQSSRVKTSSTRKTAE